METAVADFYGSLNQQHNSLFIYQYELLLTQEKHTTLDQHCVVITSDENCCSRLWWTSENFVFLGCGPSVGASSNPLPIITLGYIFLIIRHQRSIDHITHVGVPILHQSKLGFLVVANVTCSTYGNNRKRLCMNNFPVPLPKSFIRCFFFTASR